MFCIWNYVYYIIITEQVQLIIYFIESFGNFLIKQKVIIIIL